MSLWRIVRRVHIAFSSTFRLSASGYSIEMIAKPRPASGVDAPKSARSGRASEPRT